jgi:hypothetical protein
MDGRRTFSAGEDFMMKRTALAAVVFQLAVSSVSAQDRTTDLKMTASGTMLGTTINLQNNTITDEEDLAGDGTLGAFTFHGLRADATATQTPEPPAACETPLFSRSSTGQACFGLRMGASLS